MALLHGNVSMGIARNAHAPIQQCHYTIEMECSDEGSDDEYDD
jgi:hypothetical protein